MSEFAMAATTLRTAYDLAKGLLNIRDATMMQAKIVELQGVIVAAQQDALTAQESQAALLREKRALEEELANLKTWDGEKERYELAEPVSGAFAYALKKDASGPEPPHHLCAQCYQKRKKSILHQVTRMPGLCRILECHSCGSAIYLSGFWQKEHDPSGLRRR